MNCYEKYEELMKLSKTVVAQNEKMNKMIESFSDQQENEKTIINLLKK